MAKIKEILDDETFKPIEHVNTPSSQPDDAHDQSHDTHDQLIQLKGNEPMRNERFMVWPKQNERSQGKIYITSLTTPPNLCKARLHNGVESWRILPPYIANTQPHAAVINGLGGRWLYLSRTTPNIRSSPPPTIGRYNQA